MNPLRVKFRLFPAAAALCMLSLAGYTAFAASSQKPAPKSAPAKSAPASRPASSGGAASHGASGGAAHGPSANGAGSHGPTANGSHGPTANGAGSHGPTANGAHSTTSNGIHSTTANGAHSTATGGNRTSPTNRTATGRVAPAGSHTSQTRNGAVTRRANGGVSDVHDAKRGMDIHHGLDGGRRVSVTRHDGSRLVAERGRRGFIERRYNYHGHDFARRSYYWHGRQYDRFYRGYYYHGAFMNVYAPGFYYAPAFYGWAYNPWYTPVPYAWGWGGSPWFGFYGAYFTPYPVYAGPAFWLTDYLIAEQLQAAYAAQAAAAQTDGMLQVPWSAPVLVASLADPPLLPGDASAPALSPEIKQQVTDEVKAEIALENSEAQQNTQGQDADPGSSGVERLLEDGKQHVFVAGDSLDVTDSTGAECALSDGDVLQFSGPAPAASETDLSLTVLASKGGKECGTSATVTVAVTDLQEMHNHLRETIDQGMQELKTKQGTGGLPAAPPSAKAAPTQTAFSQNAPPPEQNGAADVNQQMADSDSAEKDATQSAPEAASGSDAAPAPAQTATVDISLGQTISQVTAALGQPQAVVDLGAKKIYKYKDMKITFKDGKVSDVE
ncbi:MAG: hypothetical protein WBE41_20245 [Terracidiphilus sp.]